MTANGESQRNDAGRVQIATRAGHERADSLVLTARGPGVVLADWSDASRATRYRVFKQVLTVDANFVAVATLNDSDCTLSGLPSGKTVRVRIVSANDADQGQPSAAAEIVVP